MKLTTNFQNLNIPRHLHDVIEIKEKLDLYNLSTLVLVR
jgi:hypothetical protein